LKKLLKNIFLLLNLAAVLGLLLSYLAALISPAQFWIPAFFGLAYPYLLLGNILFILLWLFTETKFVILSIVAIAIGYSHLEHYFQFSGKGSDESGIKICSYNVKNFYGETRSKKSEVAAEILAYLQSKDADIICLQEASLSGQNSIAQKNTEGKLPDTAHLKHVHASGNSGPVTYSSFPIVRKEEVHFAKTGNMIILSDLLLGKDTVRLFNCHLQSYSFSPKDIDSLDSISFNKQEESYRQVRYTGSKLKRAFIKRTEQAEKLRQLVADSPYDVILCGDFNDTPVSYTYQTVSEGLKDAFVVSGKGIGNTYLGKLPSFRIDYIFHSPSFDSFNFEVDKVEYSDHYPISCVLKRKNLKAIENN
jgi:endonuclease/exonuclease/phosphatase family metal-dependent hydrolase